MYDKDCMELSSTDRERCDRAISIARRSEVACAQIGCLAVRAGRIEALATNSYRTRCKSGLIDGQCSCHAEMGVVRQLLKKWCGDVSSWQHLIKVAEPAIVS